ncbi:MAG: aminotransferase class V-fold PLP-dependent enzyme [Paracoccaceae bacterium]|nr:aminotransferase class V-fold PLP-dependent enzyme [Paracoccaceae bacterium]
MSARVYLDWNATAPLRAEARAAMLAAMDVVGNPSSVHAEGRAARAVVERAREQLAEALGAAAADIVFTSGATEAAALALAGRDLQCAMIEHECVTAWCEAELPADADGKVALEDPANTALQLANGETGIIQDLPEGLAVSDLVQGFGKLPFGFDWSGVSIGILSAHKFGGPKGVGALVMKQGIDLLPRMRGGGQEMGRRSGTENVIGIAGLGAAAEAARRDLDNGRWDEVAALRDRLESRLLDAVPDLLIVGRGQKRLPNVTCFAVPGWKGETQVMQMDLAGFAVSAGSACSSGKVRPSKVLRAMGLDEGTASSALRVSIGPETEESDLMRFADAWIKAHHRRAATTGAAAAG